MKKTTAIFFSLSLVLSMCLPHVPAQAAKIQLSKSKLTIYVGDTYTLKLKGTKAKVKWSSNKSSIASVSSKGKISAKTSGYAVITAKAGAKKYKCKLTVKTRTIGKGTKSSPISAYNTTEFDYYQEGKKVGRFSLKLLRFESGDTAAEMAKNNSTNPVPEANQEYIYFKLQIKYISGSQTINAKDLFNYYYNIYGDNSSKHMENIDWGFAFEAVDDLGVMSLSPHNMITCGKAILVEKGHDPITFRIQTGKDSYTWFSTMK